MLTMYPEHITYQFTPEGQIHRLNCLYIYFNIYYR
jgi:hypothetical protein